LEAEYLAAARAIAANDLADNANRPQTWNLEAAWALTPGVELAARYGGSRELADAPRHEYGADLSWSPVAAATVSFEYLRSYFDTSLTAAKRSDQLTMQVALAF
jgi:hypothetical protein